jgi:hypothetical protein
MKAYGYNTLGEFTGEVDCQPNPLEWGEFIVPGYATTVEPPKPKAGKVRVWNGTKWVFQTLEATPEQIAE